MPWPQIAALIAQYGIPFVEFLISKLNTTGTPTAAEWAGLKALANVSARDELTARLSAAGIDPDSDHGKALLNLVP